MSDKVYVYHIDKDDKIFHVNKSWNEFAVENDSSHLVNSVLEKPIWDYISDGLVKNLYKELISAVRITKEAVHISFRCDSPEKMRFLEMQLFPLMDDGIAFHNILLREKTKEEGFTAEIIAIMAQAGFSMCSSCNRINVGGEWMELVDALKERKIEGTTLIAHYGMCSECATSLNKSIEDLKKSIKI